MGWVGHSGERHINRLLSIRRASAARKFPKRCAASLVQRSALRRRAVRSVSRMDRHDPFRLGGLAAIFLSGYPGMANGSASIFRPGLRRTPHVWIRLAVALMLTLAPSGLLFGTSPLNNGRILRRLHRKLVRSCGEVAGDDAKHKDAYVDKVESSGNGEFKLSVAARETLPPSKKFSRISR